MGNGEFAPHGQRALWLTVILESICLGEPRLGHFFSQRDLAGF